MRPYAVDAGNDGRGIICCYYWLWNGLNEMVAAMMKISRAARRRVVFLIFEFVIIVMGVLIALAFDEWRGNLDLDERKKHVLTSLLIDLKEDRFDFNDFATNSLKRADAARFLIEYSKSDRPHSSFWIEGPGEAIFQLAITSRLQPTRGAFDEMNATGAGIVISDNTLRSDIARYYSEAEDRMAINELIAPEIQRFRQALEDMGISYADRQDIDADTVLKNATILAIIRSLGSLASFAPVYCDTLILRNKTLIETLELSLADMQ